MNREDEIAGRWIGVTPGPWQAIDTEDASGLQLISGSIELNEDARLVAAFPFTGQNNIVANSEAIVHAPDDIDWLVRVARAARNLHDLLATTPMETQRADAWQALGTLLSETPQKEDAT